MVNSLIQTQIVQLTELTQADTGITNKKQLYNVLLYKTASTVVRHE